MFDDRRSRSEWPPLHPSCSAPALDRFRSQNPAGWGASRILQRPHPHLRQTTHSRTHCLPENLASDGWTRVNALRSLSQAAPRAMRCRPGSAPLHPEGSSSPSNQLVAPPVPPTWPCGPMSSELLAGSIQRTASRSLPWAGPGCRFFHHSLLESFHPSGGLRLSRKHRTRWHAN